MTLDDIKTEITKLPDAEIRPLLEWLSDYYDGPVWDRQIEADVARLGPEEFCGAFVARAWFELEVSAHPEPHMGHQPRRRDRDQSLFMLSSRPSQNLSPVSS